MKKLPAMFAFAGAFGLAFTTISQAQSSMKGKGMGQMKMMYDRSTVEAIQGEVVSVDSVKMSDSMLKMMGRGDGMGMMGTGSGIHVMLKSEKETIPVHLGPAWFVAKQDTKILVNDKIEVRGSRITYEEKPALCAAEVTKSTGMLKLRSKDGTPLWSEKEMRMK